MNPRFKCFALAGLFLVGGSAHAGKVSYTYDAAGRLVAADYGPGRRVQYAYDANGNLLERRASLPGASPPAITAQPATQVVAAGASVTLNIAVDGSAPLNLQWRRNGADIAGATGPNLVLPSAQDFHAGEYSVVVTNAFGTLVSRVATVTVNAAASSPSRLLNLSTRALGLTGDKLLIPGFVVAGSGSKRLLIRAVGPELANFGVTGVLEDPRIALKQSVGGVSVDIAGNDNWESNANAADIIVATNTVGAFPLSAGGKDAALLLDVPAGVYTAVTSGANDGTGVGIVELYEVPDGNATVRLVNISNRGFVGTGENIMIPGFVISSEGPKTLLIRAVGPALADFGVPGVLPDPRLRVFRRAPDTGAESEILVNDNWGENGDASTIVAAANSVGAFELPPGSRDAAFVVTLNSGVYTVHASDVGGATGVAIVEVYVVE